MPKKSSKQTLEITNSANKIREVLYKQFDKMENSYRDYQNNPYNPETTHKFRVNMRKMRAILNFIKPTLDKKIYKEMNNTIRDAAKLLSPLRETDVLIEESSKQALEEPELTEHYAEIFNYLHGKRAEILENHME